MTFKEYRAEKKLRRKEKGKYSWFLYRWRDKPYLWLIGFILDALRAVLTSLSYLLIVIMAFGVLIAIVTYSKVVYQYNYYVNTAKNVVLNSISADFSIAEGSTIYAKDGSVIANLYNTANQEYLSFNEIPNNVINAFVAVEDRSFWYNRGIDLKGLIRVGMGYIKSSGEEVHGASTLTQQLVKNTYLSSEVSIDRKVKEMLIAVGLTDKYKKTDLMEYYVNNACFGNGIYGISGAAKAYFNKGVSDLSLSETAYLCAIPNRPSYYDPLKYPDRAISRRDKILKDMKECGYITDSECRKALAEKIVINTPDYVFNNYETTYAVDCAVRYLMELNGFKFRYEFKDMDDYNGYYDNYNQVYADYRQRLYSKGYSIYTTLDTDLDEQLQTILSDGLAFNQEMDNGVYALQGAMTVIDNSTGKVIGLVGGRKQESAKVYGFNRAYQAYRQPGSSIKPLIVYTPAISSDYGYNNKTILYDIDVTEAKQPNADIQSMRGKEYTLEEAVWWSLNGTAWQVFDRITPEAGLSYLRKMRYARVCPSDYYDAASLGGFTYGVSTVEQAGGFATLANHGVYIQPTCITSILDNTGTELYKEPEPVRVYDVYASDMMVDILKGTLTSGTIQGLKWYESTDTEAFCKTGTTNDSKDGWLCGATSYYTIAVWVGYDTPKTLDTLSGGTYPGEIWKSAMLYMIKDKDTTLLEHDNTATDRDPEHSGGYYSYLMGRDDNELVEDMYLVKDYRADRVTGEYIWGVMYRMKRLDKSSSSYVTDLEGLYNLGVSYLSSIISDSYRQEMQSELDTTFRGLQ